MTTATLPGTNGTAHHHNGHAPASRLADAVQPLDAVSTVGEPKPAAAEKPPAEGRTAKGTFGPGNTFARGNPNARKMAALRAALLETMTAERMKALGDRLYAAAMAGNWIAAKLLLAYAVGKPPDAVDSDRLDLDEWKIFDAAPTLFQLLRAVLDNAAPAFASEFVQRGQQKTLDEFLKHVRERQQSESPTFGARIADERQARIGK